jgi:hypothetical protein
MTKQKILLLIPLAIIGSFLIYSCVTILSTDVVATWRHYLSFALFSILIFLFFKNNKKTLLATIFYLILGTCNLLILTPSVTTNSYGLSIGSIEMWTPGFQLLSFGLLVLLLILNFDTLVNMYFDFKEAKKL